MVVGLVMLDKPKCQCGRSPCGSIDEIGFSSSLKQFFCVLGLDCQRIGRLDYIT